MRQNTNQLLNSCSPDPNVQQSIRYEYIYLWEITLGTEVTRSTKQSYSLFMNPSWRNGNFWGKQTHCKTGENNIKSGHFYGATSHWQGWAGCGDKANANYDEGGENNLMKSMPTMMRVDKTNKTKAQYDEGEQNRQRPSMMRVEKTNKAKTHYDEGGENKATAHYDEGRENKAKAH